MLLTDAIEGIVFADKNHENEKTHTETISKLPSVRDLNHYNSFISFIYRQQYLDLEPNHGIG